jgi:IclR family transcriptional regulator, KDG regulon repressor
VAETARTADHALVVLLELGEHGPLSPAEVSRRLGLNRTVTHRLLTTLEARGFVIRAESGYLPGPLLVRIAETVQPELRVAAARPLAELHARVRETVVLHVPDGDDAVVLDERVGTRHLLRVQHEVGSRHPLAHGASGRALLAFLPAAHRARVVRASADPELVTRSVEQVRDLGYAVSHDELQRGVHGLAVPVCRPDGTAVASLAVITPATRTPRVEEGAEALRRAAAAIAATLGENVAVAS